MINENELKFLGSCLNQTRTKLLCDILFVVIEEGNKDFESIFLMESFDKCIARKNKKSKFTVQSISEDAFEKNIVLVTSVGILESKFSTSKISDADSYCMTPDLLEAICEVANFEEVDFDKFIEPLRKDLEKLNELEDVTYLQCTSKVLYETLTKQSIEDCKEVPYDYIKD
jgi:hypothetical protein